MNISKNSGNMIIRIIKIVPWLSTAKNLNKLQDTFFKKYGKPKDFSGCSKQGRKIVMLILFSQKYHISAISLLILEKKLR